MLLMRDGRKNDERTREDRATQPMDAGWLSFAIKRENMSVWGVGAGMGDGKKSIFSLFLECRSLELSMAG